MRRRFSRTRHPRWYPGEAAGDGSPRQEFGSHRFEGNERPWLVQRDGMTATREPRSSAVT